MSNSVSDFNLQTISTKELAENLHATIEFGGNIIIVGRRGSGKTQISKDVIRETGFKEIYLNLSVMERPDMGGYPNFFAPQSGKSYVDFMLPSFYKYLMEGDQKCVVLLDEVDKAETSLLAPLLEFTQFHTICGKPLKNLHAIIMTGNLQSEGGNRPSLPLLDRAEKYIIQASHHHWLDWASKTGEIHPSITAYVADHPEDLFGDVDPGEVYADPSPRGWHNSSKLVIHGEKNRWGHKILANKVAGCVGKKAGIKYAAYFDHYQVLLPVIEKIMKGEKVKEFKDLNQSKQMVASMIVCARLARKLDEEKKDASMITAKYVGEFLGNSVDPEMALIAIRSQIGIDRVTRTGLDEEPEWDAILRALVKRVNNQ